MVGSPLDSVERAQPTHTQKTLMGPQTHADKGRVDEGDAVIPRRGRSTGLGTGTANGNSSFARDAVLREAIKLGVCPEDRARLEALARFAYGTPGFRAVTPISLGEDRARQVIFEVLYTPEGPTARPLDPDSDGPPAPSRRCPSGSNAPLRSPPEPPAGSGEPDLPTVLADVASHTPDLMGAFGSTGRKMLWANDSLRNMLGVPAWASPPLIELLDDSSQGQFVVARAAEPAQPRLVAGPAHPGRSRRGADRVGRHDRGPPRGRSAPATCSS